MGTVKDSEKTRAKLIEAAGQLFAERGYDGAKVRDIVQRADVHLSALNYHFGSKAALYREVVREACRSDSIPVEARNRLLEVKPRSALLELLTAAMDAGTVTPGSEWKTAVLTWELWKPSQLFDEIVRDYLKPDADIIARLIADATGSKPEEEAVQLAVITLFGALDALRYYGKALDVIAPQLAASLQSPREIAARLADAVLTAARTPVEGEEGAR